MIVTNIICNIWLFMKISKDHHRAKNAKPAECPGKQRVYAVIKINQVTAPLTRNVAANAIIAYNSGNTPRISVLPNTL